MTATPLELAPDHRALLEASGITPGVAAERGYFTATKRTELQDLGFATYQRIVPALVLPSWGVDGSIVNYQARPDRPRVDAERGREAKYETVAESHIRLDIPPRCRPMLGRRKTPLWVTEGIRKGDGLASTGLCAVALLGVDCFRVDDWDRIALDERDVYVVYDNDVMTKLRVHQALGSLAAKLRSKGAVLHFVYLPDDEGKIGVDDFLAAGHTVEELYMLAEDELRPPPEPERPKRRPALHTFHLLQILERLFLRFVVFPDEHAPRTLALFTLHTWTLETAQATPYVYIKSPTRGSGKTRVLEVAELVCRQPLRSTSITEAGLFQAVAAYRPTFLLDEVDAVFTGRSERAEALRGVLNAGNRRGSVVIRGTADGEPQEFPTFCAKLLAGIDTGKLPDTIRDRSIVIGMQRRTRGEPIERLRVDDHADELEQLRAMLGDWAAENAERLTGYRCEPIEEISDRLEEAWEPLLGIAKLAGDPWPAWAREAAVELDRAGKSAGEPDYGALLLEALRVIFGTAEAMLSAEICAKLNDDAELPFAGWRNDHGIDARGLADILRPYGIRPKNVRVPFTGQGKGYERSQFEDAWARYTRGDEPADEPSQPSHRPTEAANPDTKPGSAGTDLGRIGVADPSRHPSRENGSTEPNPSLWDVGTDGTDEVQPPASTRVEEREA